MTVEYVNPDGMHAPVDDMYAHVAIATGSKFVRVGEQVAVDAHGGNVGPGDMAGQIQTCYEMVTTALDAAGATWRDVVHITTYTTDIDAYLKAEKDVVRPFFGDAPPPSTVVQVVRLVDPAWLVAVQVDAVR
jgi:enamine deaminase RidA (YjgF/YER057c/UK114 family)